MNELEREYWKWKDILSKLPINMQHDIWTDYYTQDESTLIKTVVRKYLKKLSKLEQLIYTNEIQGE